MMRGMMGLNPVFNSPLARARVLSMGRVPSQKIDITSAPEIGLPLEAAIATKEYNQTQGRKVEISPRAKERFNQSVLVVSEDRILP